MDDDENIEEVEQTNNTEDKENARANKQLQKLNEYIQQMAYNPIEPQRTSEHTEALSKAPKKYIIGTYTEHKDNFKPKERSERVGRIVQKHTPMTIENLEEFIRKHRKKQARDEKNKKQQQINYHETLLKLQKQCENQFMNAIVHNFAKKVSKKACGIIPSSGVETESYQRLQNSLVCHMILALEVPNQQQQSKDLTLYTKLAAVLADLILEVLFLAQNCDDEQRFGVDDQEQQLPPQKTERDLVMKLRALRAAKKKLYYQNRQKNARGCAVFSHRFNK